MAKVSPEDGSEVAVRPETPPEGWVEDPDADPPELQEGANDEFLAASRKRREEALAKRGTKRYNLALRIIGFFAILNMLTCCLPLLDGQYMLTWIKVSSLVTYGLNHNSIIDAQPNSPPMGPFQHYFTMYQSYDTSYYDTTGFLVASFVDQKAGFADPSKTAYCALVQQTRDVGAANGFRPPNDPWCESGVVAAFAFLILTLIANVAAVVLWYLLLKGEGNSSDFYKPK